MSDETQPVSPDVNTDAMPIQLGTMDQTVAMPSAEGSRPRNKRRLTIVAAISALLIAGVGAGAYAGIRAWTGSGIDEPETAVPASTAAFLRVDLKPGYRDQVAFDGLAKKFPSNTKSTSDLVTQIERKMLKGSDLDFDSDVKPWFGQRAGVGAYALDADHVVGLVVLASTDDAKAKQVLAKEQTKNGTKAFGYVVRNGYALLAVGPPTTDLQAAAAQASTQAAAHNLADDAAFRSTISHLDGHNLVLGYGNLAKLGPMMDSVMKSAGVPGDIPFPSDIPTPGGPDDILKGRSGLGGGVSGMNPLSGSLAKLTGTVAIGASVVDNGVEIRAHAQGMPATTKHSVDALAALNSMPSSTIAALAFNGLDKNSDSIKQLNAMLQSTASIAGKDGGPGGGMLGMMSGLLTNVLTSKLLTIEFGGITAGRPNLVITADTGDQAAATSLAQALGGVGAGAMPGVAVKQDGSVVSATVGSAPTGDALARSPLYQTAMKGMSNASVAAYVDVQRLIAVAGAPIQADHDLRPVKAVGLSVTSDGTNTDELVRIVITK